MGDLNPVPFYIEATTAPAQKPPKDKKERKLAIKKERKKVIKSEKKTKEMKGKKDGKNELQSCSEWEDTHWYPLNYSSGKMERSKGEIDNRCLIAMLSSPSESKHPWDSFMQHDSAYQHKHTLRSHHIFHWQTSSSHTHPRTHTSALTAAWLSVDKNSPRIWNNDFFSHYQLICRLLLRSII